MDFVKDYEIKLATLHHALDDFLTAVDHDSMILKNHRVYDVFTCALKLRKNIDAYYRRDVNSIQESH